MFAKVVLARITRSRFLVGVFLLGMETETNPRKETAEQLLFADIVSNYQEGRDELNLAEFPVSAIGNRLDPSVKTILFQDTAFDKSTGEAVRLLLFLCSLTT
jgi:hypothetical protein